MNRRKRTLLIESAAVGVVTLIAVVAVVNVKDWVNRREAMLAMDQLGRKVLQYRQSYGCVPPQNYVDSIRDDLPGHARLGTLVYRGQWIDLESKPDEILAYTRKQYRSLVVEDGFIVLCLDGRVEWMSPSAFEVLFHGQRHTEEVNRPGS